MNKVKREDALEKIKRSRNIRVILISFKAGSTGMSVTNIRDPCSYSYLKGLNLTCCNNVILTDLWWNPALEV